MSTLQNKRIFLVDDDPFWTATLNQIISELGYSDIHTFSSGKECVSNLHLNPVLIFLDYQMDDMDGIEALKRIKKYYPGIGVIFCTAYEDLSIAVNAIELGSFEYLLKSNVTYDEISSIIENAGQPKKALLTNF